MLSASLNKTFISLSHHLYCFYFSPLYIQQSFVCMFVCIVMSCKDQSLKIKIKNEMNLYIVTVGSDVDTKLNTTNVYRVRTV